MILFRKLILRDFVQKHSQATKPINRWIEIVLAANWKDHNDLKKAFNSADYIGNNRYVFNIGGNKFRLVAVVVFINGTMEIRFIGTHDEYGKIDCSEI
ncbi:mRNA interferase HigB [termite gut metagenome]|jgi:mRNA interferase HigB|uniref:mRNA interferase HigB n=1 Tax=termite gut metagenome TaxID=433724 RepID=A0A5J4Q8N7_9ZZZZ